MRKMVFGALSRPQTKYRNSDKSKIANFQFPRASDGLTSRGKHEKIYGKNVPNYPNRF